MEHGNGADNVLGHLFPTYVDMTQNTITIKGQFGNNYYLLSGPNLNRDIQARNLGKELRMYSYV